jgi:hypothetical protein
MRIKQPSHLVPLRPLGDDAANDDDPSTQLQLELKQSITQALSTRRPLLTHLNADTSWLLSIPYPPNAPDRRNRIFYHILIDPWLRGSQSDVAKFFSQQWHKEDSSVQTIGEVEDVIKGIELAAGDSSQEEVGGGYALRTGVCWAPEASSPFVVPMLTRLLQPSNTTEITQKSNIDAVVISHEFTDHMHRDTLLEIHPSVPIQATAKAANIIQSWNHFSTVFQIPNFKAQWIGNTNHLLPPWLSVTRLAYEGQDLLYYHAAVVISFASDYPDDEEQEAVIYTPHGISPRDVQTLQTAQPHIKTLALLHGLQDISLPAGAQLNLGAHNGLKIQRLLGAKYWVGTHDEVKKGGGIVSWFLNRKIIGLKEAIEKERCDALIDTAFESPNDVHFAELWNGESLTLE